MAEDQPTTTPTPTAADTAVAEESVASPTTLGAEAPAAQPAEAPRSAEPKGGWWWGTGRRKSAIARVRIRPGVGEFRIQQTKKHSRNVEEYFSEERDRLDVYAPLKQTGSKGALDVHVRVNGGGFMAQAQAIRLGLARALKNYDPTLEHTLRDQGLLTRDPREVERKKYGQPGARKQFQFSKR